MLREYFQAGFRALQQFFHNSHRIIRKLWNISILLFLTTIPLVNYMAFTETRNYKIIHKTIIPFSMIYLHWKFHKKQWENNMLQKHPMIFRPLLWTGAKQTLMLGPLYNSIYLDLTLESPDVITSSIFSYLVCFIRAQSCVSGTHS